jgi:glycosyltransferase involved in cell wall biosynthesis
MSRVVISNEFLDLHRGEKDFFLGKALARRGHEVTFLHSGQVSIPDEDAGFRRGSDAWAERLLGSQARIQTYRAARLIRRTHNKRVSYLLPNPLSYLRQLSRIRPDVIIDATYTTLTPRSLLNGLHCHRHGCRMIVLDAGDEARNRRILPFERSVMRSTAAVFTYNEASAQRIRSKYALPADHPFVVHHKMLDLEDFGFDPDRMRNRPCAGYVGRLVATKGFDRFLQYARELGPQCDFLAVGHNDDAFEIPPSVELRDAVSNKSIRSIYSEMDLLLIPDLSRFRSYATVVQEALLCGCIVRVGGISAEYFPVPSLVELHAPDDIEGLRRTIERLAALSPAEKAADRAARAARAQTLFAPERVVDLISSLLLEESRR